MHYRRKPHRTDIYVCLAKVVTAFITNITSHKINVFKIQIYIFVSIKTENVRVLASSPGNQRLMLLY